MIRTTLMLPDGLKERVIREARQEGISLGAYIRQALESALKRIPKKDDAFLRDRAVYGGTSPKDLSKNHDEYLYEEEK